MRLLTLLTACAAILACASKAQVPAAEARAERKATLLFTTDIRGEVEPCGCSVDMRGGLDRMASYVRQVPGAALVDAGDALFSELQPAADFEAQARRRAKAVADSLLSMGLVAKATFDLDRVFPELSGELFPKEVLLPKPARRTIGGIEVGLVPFDALEGDDPAPAIRREVEASRKAGAEVVVLLLHATRERAARLGPDSGADLVVASHIGSIAEGDTSRAVPATTPVFFVQARAQSLLQVEVVLRGTGPLQLAGGEEVRDAEIESIGERIRSYEQRIALMGESAEAAPFRAKVDELRARRRELADAGATPPASGNYLAYRFVPITQDRPSDPAVKAILTRYDHDVAVANLALAQAQNKTCEAPAPGAAGYVGQATCAACHGAAKAFWDQTRHAHAYETLEKANKQYDLTCIGCHVTGWERPGGPCRVDKVEGRKDVTCESCHGPGSLHAARPTEVKLVRKTPEATCLECHKPEHSTQFDYAAYLSRILGPGHGKPLK
ncbi:multiheme c-type cytochrome [Vulgatibacter incomptus]|uniref:Cytochrome c family protein n=1 Tax=Vulgatibacter incomptus TaxID=1391653 RepID=A0A0K1P8X2_9BACT|nr:multiheme c-type cytochrome [Vulgatibacter incomptus]AKU89978.1 Cytochrome c family protein [Vulgatibacter incomptus]